MSDYKLVPVEPTKEQIEEFKSMWTKGFCDDQMALNCYKAFMDAAPDVADYEQVLDDQRRLTRELDVLLNGEEGAAQQASLCDLVAQLRTVVKDTGKPILAAPDVSQLVEVLEDARTDLLEWMSSFPDELHDPTIEIIDRIDAALASPAKRNYVLIPDDLTPEMEDAAVNAAMTTNKTEAKRYNITIDKYDHPVPYETEHGQWVKYSSYKALQAECEKLRKDAERFRTIRDRLAGPTFDKHFFLELYNVGAFDQPQSR